MTPDKAMLREFKVTGVQGQCGLAMSHILAGISPAWATSPVSSLATRMVTDWLMEKPGLEKPGQIYFTDDALYCRVSLT